ncbi:DUF4132 domain-containing protein [Catenuloplanes japonicus]|uniref:DUF4132 domain-containing protein n=1 Tax=Catenuloplanes japonicus TaxID=33876 RepID=UPI000689708F|nr:DUF4132 domain-containing protein [Catenuloplanes japonicus]
MGDVPAIVKRNRQVRRGSVDAPPFVIDEKGVAARLASDRAAVLAILDDPATPEHLRTAGRAWLDEDPEATPLGAAAAIAALGGWVVYPEDNEILTPIADLLIARHGLLFAARAAVEQWLLVCPEHPRTDRFRRGKVYLSSVLLGASGASGPQLSILLRVRAAIAVATEEEYAEVVAALRPWRGRGWEAAIATDILLPSEHEWVEHDVRAALATGTPAQGRADLLLLAAGTAEQATALAPHVGNLWTWLRTLSMPATVADGAGPGAADALLTWFDEPYVASDAQRRLLSILVELDGDHVFAELLARIDRKYVSAAVLDAAARFPARAMRLFAEAGSPLLRTHVAAHPGLVDEVLPALGPAAADRVRELVAIAASVVYAPDDAVPPVLASPPWQHRPAAVKPAVITGLSCDDTESIEWREGERDRWLGLRYAGRPYGSWESLVQGGVNDGHAAMVFTTGPEEIVRPLLGTHRVRQAWYLGDWVKAVAARFELDALGFVRDAAEKSTGLTEALLPYASPALAVFIADRYARLKSARPAALAWLQRHASAAARALIPAALGKPGPGRRQAENALLTLPSTTVLAAAASYGPDAAAAVAALLDRDPLTLLPARMPANPVWAVPVMLPPVGLRDGSGALPPAAVDALVTMLAISTMDDPYAGLAPVRDLCSPDDLASFVWGLFEAWQQAGADPKQSWVLDALALLGGDETVRRLTPLILAWPGDGGHAKAVAGVRVLAAIGSDVALMRLYGIAQRAKFKGLKSAAEEKVAEVADALGLTAEQLGDRLVPDFGLDADGSMTLDYGPRRFVVGFDEQLKPTVSEAFGAKAGAEVVGTKASTEATNANDAKAGPAAASPAAASANGAEAASTTAGAATVGATGTKASAEAASPTPAKASAEAASPTGANGAEAASATVGAATVGKRLKTLPKPTTPLAEAAWKRFGALKKDVRAVAADQVRRLEQAMVTGRRWTPEEFTRYFAGHPLLWHIVRRLVWTVSNGDSFRVSEDRTFADAADRPYTLPADVTVAVAHPLDLGADLPAWSELFADYEILQPFPQLGRDTYEPTDARLARLTGAEVPTTRVLSLERRGWRREAPQDAGVQSQIERPLGPLTVVVELDPGIAVGAPDALGDQTLSAIYVHDGTGGRWRGGQGRTPFTSLSPVAASEVLRDLTTLTAS